MLGTVKYVGPALGTYSSQNEMIYDKLAHMSQLEGLSRHINPRCL